MAQAILSNRQQAIPADEPSIGQAIKGA